MHSFEKLTPSNYQKAYFIHCQCQPNPWSEAVFSDCLTDMYFAHQCVVKSEVLGYFVGLTVAGEATLMDIAVTSEAQNKGWGKLILNEFLQQARLNGNQQCWLEVRQSNGAAVHLYEQNGFEHIECRKDYYPTQNGREDGFVMCKQLTPDKS